MGRIKFPIFILMCKKILILEYNFLISSNPPLSPANRVAAIVGLVTEIMRKISSSKDNPPKFLESKIPNTQSIVIR